MEIVSLLTTTLHPPPWTTPPILTHTHTHTLHIVNFSHNQALRLLPDIFAFLVSLALMLWSRTHCVFPALYVRVFSPTMSAFFPFFFFFLFAFSFGEEDCFLLVWMKSQELNPEPKGHNKPDRCRHFALFACVFFWVGGSGNKQRW